MRALLILAVLVASACQTTPTQPEADPVVKPVDPPTTIRAPRGARQFCRDYPESPLCQG